MIALLLLAALLAAGLLYELAGSHFSSRRYPPPGQRIQLPDGSRLHLYSEGSRDEPTVIFEAGIAGSSLGWTLVQPLVAQFARSVSYDRAGLGWSDSARTPRTVSNMVSELAGLLESAQLRPPYILVGHSFGGLLVQAFAHTYPALTDAVVMVDPVTQTGWADARDRQIQRLKIGARLSRRGSWLARFGIVRGALALLASGGTRIPRLLARTSAGQGNSAIERLVGEVRKLPAEAQPIVGAHWSRPRSFNAMAAYLECLPQSARHALTMPLPADIPLVVLSAATATEEELTERAAWVAASRNGRHIRVAGTGHWLQLERPDLVASVIQDLAFRVR